MSRAVRRIAAVGSLALASVLLGPAAGAVVPSEGAAPRAAQLVTAPTAATALHAATGPSAPTPPAATVRPVPRHSGTGRRIVYSERTPQHVWLVDGSGRVVRDFAVSGRKNWPRTGTYHVFSKSPRSWSPTYGVSFRWMVRFTHGHSAAIGFHTIPRYRSGRKMHAVARLGQPVGRGGCPHSADSDARFLYRWARIGTKVVVVR